MKCIGRFWMSFVLLLVVESAVFACGPMREISYGYSFFNAAPFMDSKGYPRLLGSLRSAYRDVAFEKSPQFIDNIAEWKGRFCDHPTEADIRQVVYVSGPAVLEELRTAAKSKSIAVPMSLSSNSFAQQLAASKCTEVIDYLIFAKRCEPFVMGSNGWKGNERQSAVMYELIEEGRKKIRKLESHFVRLRYAYQVIRLAHYAGDYNLTLNLYEQLMPKVDPRVNSIIHYWILGHKAGALHRLGKTAEAAILYAKIFKECPSKRLSAFRSFSIRTNAEWEEAMLLCDSDSLRATFHAIRAYNQQSKAVEELEAIYKFHPSNQLLKTLTVREIKKLESKLLGADFKNKNYNQRSYLKLNQRESNDYLERLRLLLEKIAAEGKSNNQEFWNISLGYLHVLQNDYEPAKKIFRDILETTETPNVKLQLESFLTQVRILEWRSANENVEYAVDKIYDDEEPITRKRDFEKFLFDKLAFLYGKSDAPGRAYLCQNDYSTMTSNPSMEMIDDLLAISDKIKKNPMERSLVEPDGVSIKNDLLDLKAMMYLKDGNVEAANEIWKKIPRQNWIDFGIFNPFEERFRECVHCPLKFETDSLTKGQILEMVLDLDYKVKGEIGQNSDYLYQLGLFWFNITYFGHSWDMVDRYRSGSNWYYRNVDRVFTDWAFPLGNREFHDLGKAQVYFEKARQAAESEGKMELAAKASYMAARCEQNFFFTMPNKPEKRPREYFKILFQKYGETEFFEDIEEECKYLEFYVDKMIGE